MERKRITGTKSAIKSVYHSLIPFFIFLVFTVIFFSRLFYPAESVFMIPDFGESDVLHFHLPLKEILSRSLKNLEFPHWTAQLLGGFPVLAEGQIGTFYLPNLLLFRFLPTVTAYNLNLALSFLLIALGTYAFTRKLGFGRNVSIYIALIFTFSGFFSVHLNHFDIIQTASLTPLLFWAAYILWQKPGLKSAAVFSFLLSQQIFAGYLYIVFIGLTGIIIFLAVLPVKQFSFNKLIALIGSIILSFLLSGVQLLPTIELWRISTKSTGLDYAAVTAFPYPVKHLLSFFSPYIFGNPATGTYPKFDINWGIFWENTAYIGLVPLILAILSVIFIRKNQVRTWLVVLIFSILLVLGKNSPVYFIFGLPPFSFLRVTSRFLLLTAFSLSILSGFLLEKILRSLKKLKNYRFIASLLYLLLTVTYLSDGFRFSYNYPPVSPSNWWFQKPEIANMFGPKLQRLKSYASELVWNEIFLTGGWQDLKSYIPLNNSFPPNYNIFWDISQASINIGGLVPRRHQIWRDLTDGYKYDKNTNTLSVSVASEGSLSLWGVDTIISAYQLEVKDWKPAGKINPGGNVNFFVYKNTNVRDSVYFAGGSEKIETVEDFHKKLEEPERNINTVYLEDEFDFDTPNSYAINEVSAGVQNQVYSIDSDKEGLLVFNRSFYPGWQARIDDRPVNVLTVNLNQPAVIVPRGSHRIEVFYQSQVFEIGKYLTIVSGFITFSAVFLGSLSFAHKPAGRRKRASGLSGRMRS